MPTYTITFNELGLRICPATSWAVTVEFNGVPDTTGSSSNEIVSPNVPNGKYSFSVTYVEGYTASPTSGIVTVNGAATKQQITFTPVRLQGISNDITGVTSLAPYGYSLQQNFFLYTGSLDSQGNPEVYWCQNVVASYKRRGRRVR